MSWSRRNAARQEPSTAVDSVGRLAPVVCLTAILLGCSPACTKPEPRGHIPAASGSQPTASSVASSAGSAPKTAGIEPEDWVEAVRLERWSRAATLIDALPDESKRQPEMRYVRARIALAQRDYARTLVLLDGLEKQLTSLSADIGHHRAEAQLHGGQEKEAAQYFARRASVPALTKAAMAWSRAGQEKQARATIDRAIQLAKKRVDDDVVDARRLRADLAEASGDRVVAIVDLRFIARHAQDAEEADAALVRLEQLDPKQRLTSSEHMDRAEDHAQRGHADRAIEEIERAVKAPGGPPSKIDQLVARARALYKSRGDYARAAESYEQAAAIRGGHVPQCLYFAAKAWSRANDNERGLELYDRLIKKYPRTTWAERASYYAPRLRRFQAQWPLAEKGYLAYLKRYPSGMFADEARYEAALCQLRAGKHDAARKQFEKLAHDEKEALDAMSFRYLAAVAAHEGGKTKVAIDTWRSMISSSPLSWFALASAARLSSVGQSPPPPIAPAPATRGVPLNIKLPPAVRLLRDIGLDRDAESLLRGMEDAIESSQGDRGGEALCNAYQQLHTAGRLHRIGQRHAPVRLVLMAPSNATRWAWDCLYPRPYPSTVSQLEEREKLPQGLLHAVMRQESAFNPDARSPVGAHGLMQLMPSTASKTARNMSLEFNLEEVTSPGMNLDIGSHYLGMLLGMMKGSVPLAAGAYNAGPNAVGRWVERTGDVPLDVWVALVPYRETRRYIWRVVGNWARYRYLAQGESGIPVLDLRIPSGITVPEDAY